MLGEEQMDFFLSLWNSTQDVARSIDPTTAWTIIAAEGTFIATLVGIIVAQQKRYERKVTEMGEKINALYDKRVEDMKSGLDLVATLEGVVYKQRKGGKP